LTVKLGVLKFQVILQIVHVHDAHDGDAIFLQNEILAIHVSPPDDLPEVDARLSQRNTVHYALHDFKVLVMFD